ncbi:TPA: hypothetical protein ACMY33_001008 [Yersinia enterocolitica]|nr:hypothetical protein [Yersinia enterocolitica]HEB0979900.1 hypothetical protein [Yersinia enterocolitica]HEB1851435.1 hypothetical protein [Yersinia enterocolitica]
MTTKKTNISETTHEKASEELNAPEKTCFVIMPIADNPTYDNGHFDRVYKHLIAPACRVAGFTPIRADEVNSSNMIVLDILKKIVECDIAVCDLSSKNPNVLYELGLRQAFNKKTVLIKDRITTSPFDVQAFRYAEYDNTLRVDYVQNEILSLAASIKSTYEAKDDINSIVQLLQIEPAKIGEKTQLSTTDTIILSAIKNLTNRVDNLSITNAYSNVSSIRRNTANSALTGYVKSGSKNIYRTPITLNEIIATNSISSIKENFEFFYNDESIGNLESFDTKNGVISFFTPDGERIGFASTLEYLNTIYGINHSSNS